MSEAAQTAVSVDARRGGWFAVVLRGRAIQAMGLPEEPERFRGTYLPSVTPA